MREGGIGKEPELVLDFGEIPALRPEAIQVLSGEIGHVGGDASTRIQGATRPVC